MDRAILHVDFDYFYAQCEEIRTPRLRTIPVCVCIYSNRGGGSGAVATANYQARKFGARSGMPIHQASRLLRDTDAEFIPVDFDYYSDISEKAMEIMQRFADIFEYVGRDEAYLDVTARVGGELTRAAHIAQQMKNEIRESLRMTCSVGVTQNKLLSKIASDFKKPDGLTVVRPESLESFLESLKPSDIPGIGGKTVQKLDKMGVSTIAQLKSQDIFEMQRLFGRKSATFMYNSARGINDEPVKKRPPSLQYSKIVTLKQDAKSHTEMRSQIQSLCKILHDIVTERGLRFRTVSVIFVHTDMTNRSRSRTVRNSTSSLEKMQEIAHILVQEAMQEQPQYVRRLGIKVSELSTVRGQQSITDYV